MGLIAGRKEKQLLLNQLITSDKPKFLVVRGEESR